MKYNEPLKTLGPLAAKVFTELQHITRIASEVATCVSVRDDRPCASWPLIPRGKATTRRIGVPKHLPTGRVSWMISTPHA